VQKRYFLYDLFEYDESFSHHAMPEHSKTLYDEVKDLFKSEKNVVITKGKLPETLSINCPEKISFMHLDLNNVDAEIGTLEILFEKMVPGSIIVLDDFGWMYYEQQNISELNWFNKKGYSVLEIPTGQGILIKR
jgi:O-methyltransferase